MSFLGDLSGSQGLANMANNLAQNAAMNQGQQAAMQQQANFTAANQAVLDNLYGPQGFGGQTAQYAAAGAAYGRNTGYYGDTSGLPPGQAPLPGASRGYPSGDVWRGQDLPDLSKPWINPVGSWEAGYGERNPDVLAAARASGGDINAFLQNHLANNGMYENRQVFDSVKYLQDNPDVRAAGVDAWTHYNTAGRNEGRAAEWGNVFNPQTYLSLNPDVAAAGVNPLQHWLQQGTREGRQGGGFVEATPYNDFGLNGTFNSATGNAGQSPGMAPGYGGFNNPAVPTSPQQWYANGGYDPYDLTTYSGSAQQNLGGAYGGPFGSSPTGTESGGYNPQWGGSSTHPKGAMLDQDWLNYYNTATAPGAGSQGRGWEAEYLLANPDVAAAAAASGMNVNAFADMHYLSNGRNEGRTWFDANEYLKDNPDVAAAGVNPFAHYYNNGRYEGRAAPMSGTFDAWGYLQQNPDVAAAGVDPLAHWLQAGQHEGRDPSLNWDSYYNRASTTPGTVGHGWEAAYLLANPDVAAAAERTGGDVNAFADMHYLSNGRNEGRSIFDANASMQQNPDVFATGANPFEYYYKQGGGDMPRSGTFDPETYLALNPDVAAAGVDPLAHYLQAGQNEGRVGGFAPSNYALRDAHAAAPDDSAGNLLVPQRAGYANTIRDDPNLSLKLAARLYSEDQNNPDTRVAILEAMLNRLAATGQDPLNLAYYPADKKYNSALSKVSGNNELLNQIYQEMERAFGGSNLSNYATDWASAGVADNERQYATPTWTSPTNEQFFRKDLNNDWTGAGTAAKNQAWYGSVTSPPH